MPYNHALRARHPMQVQSFTQTTVDALPVLDLSLLKQCAAATQEFREKLREVTHTIGFFYLDSHGIHEQTIQEIFGESRKFFAMPFKDSNKHEVDKNKQYGGYTRACVDISIG